MTVTAVLTLSLWLVAGVSVTVGSLVVLRSAHATVFEALALAFFAGVNVPPLIAQWVWFVPMGALEHLSVAAFVCILGSALVLRRYGGWRNSVPDAVSTRSILEFSAVGLAAGAVAAYSAFVALLKPVDGWDALMYHGPTTVKLITARSMYGWNLNSSYGFYPNLTAFMATPVAAATKSTRWMDAVQVVPWLALFLCAWAWAGRGRPKVFAGTVILMAATAPAIFTQLRSLAVDVVYAGGVLVLVFGAALWAQRRTRVYAVWAALGLMVAVASKPSGAVLAAALFVALVVAFAIRRRRWLYRAAALVAGAAFLGAPLYLRNLTEFSNPIYPVSMESPVRLRGAFPADMFLKGSAPTFGDQPAVVGFFRNLWEGIVHPPTYYTWDMREGGFGSTTLWIACIAAAGLVVLLVLRRFSRPSVSTMVLIAGTLVVLAVQPMSWYPRYSFAPYVMIAIAVALVADRGLATQRLAWPMAFVLLGLIAHQLDMTEARFAAGLGVVERTRVIWPGYGDTFGADTNFGYSLSTLASAPCGSLVVVEANDDQRGRFSTYSLALWGDHLCNSVKFVHANGADFIRALSDTLPLTDFVVVDMADLPAVEQLAAEEGLTASVVGNPMALSDGVQAVVQLTP